MGDLRRFKDTVVVDLSDDFLASDDPRNVWDPEDAATTEEVGDHALARADELIKNAIADHAAESAGIDRAIVVPFHQSLPLSRLDASDGRMWAWLGVCRYPHFVAHRWAAKSGLRSKERFNGSAVRQTFARMWWAAELTVNDGDYALTEQLLALPGFQDIYEAMFGRAFARHRAAMSAFIAVLGTRPERVIRETAKEFGYLLTTMVLELMTEGQIRDELTWLAERVEERLGVEKRAPRSAEHAITVSGQR